MLMLMSRDIELLLLVSRVSKLLMSVSRVVELLMSVSRVVKLLMSVSRVVMLLMSVSRVVKLLMSMVRDMDFLILIRNLSDMVSWTARFLFWNTWRDSPVTDWPYLPACANRSSSSAATMAFAAATAGLASCTSDQPPKDRHRYPSVCPG